MRRKADRELDQRHRDQAVRGESQGPVQQIQDEFSRVKMPTRQPAQRSSLSIKDQQTDDG